MVPTILGDCYETDCLDCGFSFPFSAKSVNQNSKIVCPNCGYDRLNQADAKRVSAPPVEVVDAKTLSRFDIVAFRLPNENAFGVKRMVGLPGETIEFRHGDLWGNGALLRKSLNKQREMRIGKP